MFWAQPHSLQCIATVTTVCLLTFNWRSTDYCSFLLVAQSVSFDPNFKIQDIITFIYFTMTIKLLILNVYFY